MLKSSSCVVSLVSANLMRGSFLFCSFKPCTRRLVTATSSVSYTSRLHTGIRLMAWNNPTRFESVYQTGPPEFPGGDSPDELPSRPSSEPEWTPEEVQEIPRTPEVDPAATPPEFTTLPSDPPPLGPPPNPGPEIPVPPSPSPPMPDTPNVPVPPPGTPPDVVPPRPPPDWEPPRPPEIVPPPGVPPDGLPPGIDPPKGPFVI